MKCIKNIGRMLKITAWSILVAGEMGGLLWFIISLSNYTEYQDFLDFQYITSEYTFLAQQGQTGIIFSSIFMLTVFITFLMLYGFSEIIFCLQEIKSAMQEQNAMLIQKIFDIKKDD